MDDSIIQSYYKRNDLNHIEELIMRVTNYAWSEMTLVEQGELREKAAAELAALREAGNKLAQIAKDYERIDDLLDAIGEWEAANK